MQCARYGLLSLIPTAVLGVILVFTGLELASIVRDIDYKMTDICVLLVTAAIAIVNMGVAFLAEWAGTFDASVLRC